MPKNLIRRVLMKLDKNYLPYEYFVSFDFFEDIEIFDGVTIHRLPSREGLYFKSTIKKDVEVIEHYHNAVEYLFIKKGKILVNNKVELNEGDEIEFEPFELHQIQVLEEAELFVQFIKDKPYKDLEK